MAYGLCKKTSKTLISLNLLIDENSSLLKKPEQAPKHLPPPPFHHDNSDCHFCCEEIVWPIACVRAMILLLLYLNIVAKEMSLFLTNFTYDYLVVKRHHGLWVV